MTLRPALDPLSRRTLIGFALRSGALALGAAALAVFHVLPLQSVLRFSSALCGIAVVFAVGRAARRSELLARGGLNAWDEAAAFWAAFLALHAVERLSV